MSLRQQAVLERLVGRVEAASHVEGAILIGSFATGEADDLSDLDVLVLVADGRFEEGWRARRALEGDEALAAWDDIDPEHAEIGGHKWLTHDLVLVECLLATASSGVRLAGEHRVVVGDQALPARLARRPPFTREEIDEYAQLRTDVGRAHEIETAYGRLAKAVRAARAPS